MDVLEQQLKLIRADLKKKSRCELREIQGRYRWIGEEPCQWNIVRFEPENEDEWQQWMDDEEYMSTGKGKTLLQIKKRLFYFKGQWTDDHTLFTCPQDDYQFARFKQCTDELRNKSNWSWAVSRFLTAGGGKISRVINDNTKIPDFKQMSLNVIVGTPGAGKSTFCAEFVKKKTEKYKILYVGPAHTNVNSFLRKLTSGGVKDVAVLSDEAKLEKDLRKYHNSNMKSYNPQRKNLILPDKRVTISTINKPIKSPKESGVQIIIIDEATRVSLLEVLTFIHRFNNLLCIILAGDPRQLGARIGQTDVKDVMRYTLDHGEAHIWNLFKQYRFGAGINNVLSTLFYKNQMEAATNQVSAINWVIIRKCGCDIEDKIGCDREVKIALAVFKFLKSSDKVILTPYKRQIEKFVRAESEVKIKTIDTAQGDEYQHVIFSFGRHRGRGFVTNERINVGLSRAKQSVHVIINETILKSLPRIERVIKEADKEGYVNYC